MSTTEFSYHFEQLSKPLMAFAMRLTRDEEMAKDLVQETACRAFRFSNQYRPDTNLRAWLMTIMRNTFINDYRKQRRRRLIQSQMDDAVAWNGGSTVENAGEMNLRKQEVINALQEVDALFRIPLLMYCEGYTYEEIADELDAPIGTIKSRIFLARKQLRKKYATRDWDV